MSYIKQNLYTNQILRAEHLNNIENGIIANENAIADKQPKGNYATQDFVTSKIAEAQLSGGNGNAVDLTAYPTKEEVAASYQLKGDYVTKESADSDYQPKGDYVTNDIVAGSYQPKGNYLTEHQKLKTINGVSLVGEGNIEISGSGGGTNVQQAYVSVKYLENTGTQYIDTGYVVHEDDEITVDYEIPANALTVKTDKILIDARDNTNGIRVSTWGDNWKWYARFGHNTGATSVAFTNKYQKGTFTISKNTFVINGAVVFSEMVFTAMPTGTLKLFMGRNLINNINKKGVDVNGQIHTTITPRPEN